MGLFDQMMSSVNNIAAAVGGAGGAAGLDASWTANRRVEIKPVENLEELKAAVNVSDPGSVAAYYVYAVMALTADKDTGLGMMKYLFADLEPFGRGFTEGGTNGGAVFRILGGMEADVVELFKGREHFLALGELRQLADEHEIANTTAQGS